ncbi:hypothetical protein LSH36_15g09011, partial [Paralvinella palmiformis]
MPVYGSFYGKEQILRMALFVIGQSIVASITSRFLLLADPIIHIAITIAFLSVRVSIIPGPLVWLFDKVMFVSEPLWQLLEALGVVFFIMEISQEAADHMDDQPGLAKGNPNLFTFVYCLNFRVLSLVYVVRAICLSCIFYGVLSMQGLAFIFGILSDAAVVAACSMAMLYHVSHNTLLSTTQIQVPTSWTKSACHNKEFTLDFCFSYTSDHSYSQMMLRIVAVGLDSGSHTLQFFTHMLSPCFIMMTISRICCVLYAIGLARLLLNKLAEWSNEDSQLEDEFNLDTEEEEELPIMLMLTRSPLLIKLVVIFVYTQFLICYVNIYHLNNSWLSWLQ